MIGIINWLKGYLRIRVTGVAVERFINLCAYKNILLWDVTQKEHHHEMFISVWGFKELRPIVKKTKIKVAILQRVGLPFFMSDLNKRKIFLIGCMLTIFFWQISGYFIWNIEITGNYQITTEQIQDFLEVNNITIGKQKKHINIENLEKELRKNFTQVTWVSGKIQGTTLYLDIKEAEISQLSQEIDEGFRYDLIAPVDGVIDSIIVRKGIPQVKPEEAVTKGMVLVEGIVPVMNDDGTLKENLYVQSDADVYIRYNYPYSESLNEKYIKKYYTGRETVIPYIRFGEKELSLKQESNFLLSDLVIQEKTSKFMDELNIPLKWGQFLYREYMNMETFYTKEEAHSILEQNFNKFLSTLSEKGVQIIEKDVTINKSGSEWIISGQLTLSEPVTTLIKVEDTNILETLEN